MQIIKCVMQFTGFVTQITECMMQLTGLVTQITECMIELIDSGTQITICKMQTITTVTPITKFMMMVHLYAMSKDIWMIYYGKLQYHIPFYHTKPSLFVKESNK